MNYPACNVNHNAGEWTVIHIPGEQQFCIVLPDEDKCVLLYERTGDVVDMWHTEVPLNWRGQGLGGDLMKGAMEWVMQRKYKAKLSCTFLQKFIRDNPNPAWEKVVVT